MQFSIDGFGGVQLLLQLPFQGFLLGDELGLDRVEFLLLEVVAVVLLLADDCDPGSELIDVRPVVAGHSLVLLQQRRGEGHSGGRVLAAGRLVLVVQFGEGEVEHSITQSKIIAALITLARIRPSAGRTTSIGLL